MDLLKSWMGQRTASFTEEARRYGLPEPKGILLLGVQGCGKSLIAKAIASLWRLPLLRLDVGKIFAGIVGSSEENMRKAIATAESVAPCVTGDTRITLADGSEKTIQELYDGDRTELTVLGMSDDWKIVPVRVKAVTRRPAPDLYTVRTRHNTLQATGNHLHPVMRNGELVWVRSDELAVGDHIAMPRQIPTRTDAPAMVTFLPADTRLYAPDALAYARPEVQTPQRRYAARERGADYVKIGELSNEGCYPAFATVTQFAIGRGGTTDSVIPRLPAMLPDEVGYLLGLIESDGYLGKSNTIGFVNTDTTLHRLFSQLLCRLFGLETATHLNATPEKNSRLSGTSEQSVFKPCYTSKVTNRLLCTVLRAVRAQLLTMPESFLNAFVRGYFDGDGCVSDSKTGAVPRIILTAKRKEQNAWMRSVLLRIGFATSNPEHFNIEITGWQNVQRFIEQIGSQHPCRRERMEEWLAQEAPTELKDRNDPLPVGALLRQVRQSIGMGSQHFQSTGSSLLHRYEHGIGHPNRERLHGIIAEMRQWAQVNGKALEGIERLAALVEGQTAWTPVLSVEATEKPEFVYDLACEGTHNFVANNLITHNCVLWIDELEKGFAGTQSSPFSDGGTTSRVFGTFITWMQDKQAACFVIATSNDVSQLPPELMRKGRFDEIFFVDLPAFEERREIFSIHLRKRGRNTEAFDLDTLAKKAAGYSGAEIEQVVVSALFHAFEDNHRELTSDDLISAMRESVPLSVTMKEGIDKLRDWAATRARPSSSTTVEPMETWEETLEQAAAKQERERAAREARRGGSAGFLGGTNSKSADARAMPKSPYDMEADNSEANDPTYNALNARLAALERKTSTGLDTLMHETQNLDLGPAPQIPTVESQGTSATVRPVPEAPSSTDSPAAGPDEATNDGPEGKTDE